MFSLSQPCPTCRGRGQVVETPCGSCHGTGREASTRSVKVRIPSGVEDGQRIRVKGRGAPGQSTAPPGDLYVVVHVGSDPRFGRKGRNLTTTATVSYPDAVLGSTVTVDTLGAPVTLKVPAGTASGTTLRVRGRGVPEGTGKKARPAGDLLVKVEVQVPKVLSDAQRAAVEALRDALAPEVAAEDAPAEEVTA
jgi:molecular chaperone DnaJ